MLFHRRRERLFVVLLFWFIRRKSTHSSFCIIILGANTKVKDRKYPREIYFYCVLSKNHKSHSLLSILGEVGLFFHLILFLN